LAATLRRSGLASCLIDCLTREEEGIDFITGHLRANDAFLAGRFLHALSWLEREPEFSGLPVCAMGAGLAAAALFAAAPPDPPPTALVALNGQLSQGHTDLTQITTPTLLIVEELYPELMDGNRRAFDLLPRHKDLVVVRASGRSIETEADLERIAELSGLFMIDVIDPKGDRSAALRIEHRGVPPTFPRFDS